MSINKECKERKKGGITFGLFLVQINIM